MQKPSELVELFNFNKTAQRFLGEMLETHLYTVAKKLARRQEEWNFKNEEFTLEEFEKYMLERTEENLRLYINDVNQILNNLPELVVNLLERHYIVTRIYKNTLADPFLYSYKKKSRYSYFFDVEEPEK